MKSNLLNVMSSSLMQVFLPQFNQNQNSHFESFVVRLRKKHFHEFINLLIQNEQRSLHMYVDAFALSALIHATHLVKFVRYQKVLIRGVVLVLPTCRG